MLAVDDERCIANSGDVVVGGLAYTVGGRRRDNSSQQR